MPNPIKIRAKAMGSDVDVKALIAHDMETGFRKTADGQIVPAHYIQTLVVKCNERVVLQANWGPAVSKDPFFSFQFKGGAVGDTIEINWLDSQGIRRTDKTKVQ